jgi:hypothetical protein
MSARSPGVLPEEGGGGGAMVLDSVTTIPGGMVSDRGLGDGDFFRGGSRKIIYSNDARAIRIVTTRNRRINEFMQA